MNNLESLKKIFDRENYTDQAEAKFVYQSDASLEEGIAAAVVWPIQGKQLVELVKWAREKKTNLIARGAGTGLVGGCVPLEQGIVVDFSKMNRILDFDLASKKVRLEPGVVLDDLNRFLAREDLFFPISPGSHAVCTLGGMLATDAGGLTSVKYGKIRNWVEKIKLVDGQGEIKEIRGEELSQIIGLEGTTGFIIETEIRITQKPVITYEIKEFTGSSEVLSEVINLGSNSDIIALEYVNPLAAQIGEFPWLTNYLFIGRETKKDTTPLQIKTLWQKRENLAPILFQAGYSIIEDPILPLEKMSELFQWFKERQIPCFGHLGARIIHPHFQPQQQQEIEEMYGLIEKLGGQVSGEHGVGLKKKQFISEQTKRLFIQYKDKFDPCHLFNKNKILS